jgi:hypothetical protein
MPSVSPSINVVIVESFISPRVTLGKIQSPKHRTLGKEPDSGSEGSRSVENMVEVPSTITSLSPQQEIIGSDH